MTDYCPNCMNDMRTNFRWDSGSHEICLKCGWQKGTTMNSELQRARRKARFSMRVELPGGQTTLRGLEG